MAEYHVGCGAFGIYAGTLNKKGDKWLNMSEVTDEACRSVAQHMIEHNEKMRFSYNGRRYELAVKESEDTDEQSTEA